MESAWARYLQIFGGKSAEERLVTSSTPKYPVLSRRGSKPLLIIPEPMRVKKELWSFEGMVFRNDAVSKSALWHLFLASVDHISLHSVLSSYPLYSEWSKPKDDNLAIFAASLVEDAHIESYAARTLPDVFATQAFADTLGYIRLKQPTYILNESMKAQTALLMQINVGRIDGTISSDMEKSVQHISYLLRELKSKLAGATSELEEKDPDNPVDKMKLNVANDIYRDLEPYGNPPEIAALPHQDHHGECHIFTNLPSKVPQEEIEKLFELVYLNLGGNEDYVPSSIIAPSIAADNVYSKWEIKNKLKHKILDKYSSLAEDGHFHKIEFPPEDYGEYLRLRSKMSGSTNRIIEQVRMVKNELDDSFREEAGLIDLQEAIQVIASRAHRSDIFIREETLKKSEGWTILVDMSNSTRGITGETKRYATCLSGVAAVALAELTSGLTGPNDPWGMYGFSDKFYIIKDFDEPYTSAVKARIGGVKPGGLTFLPDAINIAAKIIQSSSLCERNFLIVISDGLPTGYSGIEDDLTESLNKIERAGILPLAVGLGKKSIKRFFRHHLIITDPLDLVKRYIRAYQELSG